MDEKLTRWSQEMKDGDKLIIHFEKPISFSIGDTLRFKLTWDEINGWTASDVRKVKIEPSGG